MSAYAFREVINVLINEVSKIGANVKVQNGALINNDSISFNIQFEDDETPFGYTYQIKGHRK